ncbi:MAG: hypothetical protein H0U90_11425 [Actinobacteria bacterium]|nr:hypothetical protein [Actinomycetota bacterium]
MSAESGGQTIEEGGSREWLLGCEGFRVDGPEGRLVGHVAAPIYGFSARWDRPSALAIRGPDGTFALELDAIQSVFPAEARIVLRALELPAQARP